MNGILSRRRLFSLGIGAVALTLAAAPVPGLRRPLAVAVGSELEPAMQEIEPLFERRHPGIDLQWQVRGSQEMVNRANDGGPERPRVLIPANRDLLTELAAGAGVNGGASPFTQAPVPIARTLLVAVAWPERAQLLFPDGRLSWPRLREAAATGQWAALGGPAGWGSFDLRLTDPLRSSSGQLTLALWCRGQARADCAASLKRSTYRPARSTDILLREFISSGPNEGDLAMVYEASALARQGEARRQQNGGYRLLFPDPTFETVLAAAVLRGAGNGTPTDGLRFATFLAGTEGQSVLARHGFRRPDGSGGSPLAQGVRRLSPPSRAERDQLLREWQQAG